MIDFGSNAGAAEVLHLTIWFETWNFIQSIPLTHQSHQSHNSKETARHGRRKWRMTFADF
jgi:hypothetical protein